MSAFSHKAKREWKMSERSVSFASKYADFICKHLQPCCDSSSGAPAHIWYSYSEMDRFLLAFRTPEDSGQGTWVLAQWLWVCETGRGQPRRTKIFFLNCPTHSHNEKTLIVNKGGTVIGTPWGECQDSAQWTAMGWSGRDGWLYKVRCVNVLLKRK